MFASRGDRPNVMKLLLEAGADIEAKNEVSSNASMLSNAHLT
jgi:ankyrin repeat protein